jgi:hypothetical protein
MRVQAHNLATKEHPSGEASSHNLDRLRIDFDAPGLVANAGLVLPATLARHLGLPALLRHHVRLGKVAGGANLDVKAMTTIASLLAGGEWMDDINALRAGGLGPRRRLLRRGGPRPAPHPRRPPIRTGYEHFRLERQGELVSPKTLEYYDGMVLPFLDWLDGEGVQRFEHLDVEHARRYRARLASTPGSNGRQRQPATLHGSHRAIRAFLRWASREGYTIDGRILDLASPRVPKKEPTVYHIAQLRTLLAACKPEVPTEDLTVRLLVGSGIRRAEVCGLAVTAPDGLHDLMSDSLQRGRVELRVRWDGARRAASRGASRSRPSWLPRSSGTRRGTGQTSSIRTCSSTSTAGRTRSAGSTA